MLRPGRLEQHRAADPGGARQRDARGAAAAAAPAGGAAALGGQRAALRLLAEQRAAPRLQRHLPVALASHRPSSVEGRVY